jgi:transposase
MGGRRRPVLDGELAWLLARLAERPELTVRTLAAELAERGKPVSPNTVWVLLRRAGHSFKKNVVRHRAGPTGNRQAAGTVEEVSGSA